MFSSKDTVKAWLLLLKNKKQTNKQTKKDIAVVLKTDLLLQSNAIVFAIVVPGGY